MGRKKEDDATDGKLPTAILPRCRGKHVAFFIFLPQVRESLGEKV